MMIVFIAASFHLLLLVLGVSLCRSTGKPTPRMEVEDGVPWPHEPTEA